MLSENEKRKERNIREVDGKDLILVIDTGSSSMRGILFDREGKILATKSRTYFMRTGPGGVAEQDPEDYRFALTEICQALAAFCRGKEAKIRALSFTSQRSSILPLGKDGKPLHSIITWYDKRSVSVCEEFEHAYGEELYELTGTRLTPVLSAPKMVWLKRQEPELYKATDKIVGIHDYLLYLCTGKLATDESLASRTYLMDIRKRCWSDRLLAIFGLEKEKLCQLLVPGAVVGSVTDSFAERTGIPAEIPVITGGGDQQCSILGQGLILGGDIGITVGTGAYVAMVCDHPVFDNAGKRINLNAAVVPGKWIAEASTMTSGSAWDWFRKNFYGDSDPTVSIRQINADAGKSPAGAGGLLALSSLAGKGCPDWDDYARGGFFGITPSTKKEDFARALLEGIAAEIAECYETLSSLYPGTGRVSVTGGMTKFFVFDQILADMIEISIKKCTIEETTAIGAFLTAAAAMGWQESPEAAAVFYGLSDDNAMQTFRPDPSCSAVYRRFNQARQNLYHSLPTREVSTL
ncbi:MAG: hypothetical protein HFI63_02485 [Lachnospiraceae bacterium]|nr:hypothetical protein [Lachnospiraceae bacterium]